VGYGPYFNMGRHHAEEINSTEGLKVVAICDRDPERVKQAKRDFPDVDVYTDIKKFLGNPKVEVVTIVTPHNTHKELTILSLKAEKNVVVEKPMCLTLKEADEMINLAQKKKLMLTVYHNRRWDGDFLAIEEIVNKGIIGKVFNVEVFMGGYHPPRQWWRSEKEISGGYFYDWGAHIVFWVLALIKYKIKKIYGVSQKRVWHYVSNEDEIKSIIIFEDKEVADIQVSSISTVPKPKWRILGEKGGISGNFGENLKVFEYTSGGIIEKNVGVKPSQWHKFYQNIADHLLMGEVLEITPFMGRRVIGVIEKTMESAEKGVPLSFE